MTMQRDEWSHLMLPIASVSVGAAVNRDVTSGTSSDRLETLLGPANVDAGVKRPPDSTADGNDVLKAKFRKLHRELFNIDVTPIIDELFANYVISSDDLQVLYDCDTARQKTEKLLLMLHKSRHPRAFIHLRDAIRSLPHDGYAWIIDRLDELRVDTEAQEMYRDIQLASQSKLTNTPALEESAEVRLTYTSPMEEARFLNDSPAAEPAYNRLIHNHARYVNVEGGFRSPSVVDCEGVYAEIFPGNGTMLRNQQFSPAPQTQRSNPGFFGRIFRSKKTAKEKGSKTTPEFQLSQQHLLTAENSLERFLE